MVQKGQMIRILETRTTITSRYMNPHILSVITPLALATTIKYGRIGAPQ